MPRPTMWILVADAARARVFRLERPGSRLAPALDRELVADNVPSHELASDRPGRSFDSAGQGRHAMEPPTDPKRYEKQRFARQVVELLDAQRRHNAFARLAVVAAPQMLGDLRAAMADELRKIVELEIAKDFSKLSSDQIEQHLQELTEPGVLR
ncbi:MAG: host attachment protein [Alphaproteobacteria bacterium]|nr:host attachment protein [Alphaproteobacteria bacterium]